MSSDSFGGIELEELLADPHVAAVGLVTMNAAAMELGVTYVLWAVNEVRGKTNEEGAPEARLLIERLRELRRVARQRFPDASVGRHIEDFASRVETLAKERNRMIHDVWLAKSRHETSYTQIQTTWRGRNEETGRQVYFDDVVATASGLWQAWEDAVDLVAEILQTQAKQIC